MIKKKYLFILSILFINIISSVSALTLIVHVPEKYTNVISGERFYFEIEVKYPENPSRKDLRLEYEVLTVDGNLIAQSKALKAVETQASFIDFIIIPESAKSGLHLINVKVKDYESLNEEVSASFQVIESGWDQTMIYLMIILAAIILVGVMVVTSIVLARKKKK